MLLNQSINNLLICIGNVRKYIHERIESSVWGESVVKELAERIKHTSRQ